jgi:hypothetical protein
VEAGGVTAAGGKRRTLFVAGLLGLAIVLRGSLWLRIPILWPDGVVYLEMARSFSKGLWAEGLAGIYHPLYPLLIGLLHRLIGVFGLAPPRETVAGLLSVFLGSATLLPLYLLVRRMADGKTAIIAAVLLALQPYAVRWSAEVMSDSVFLFFLYLSIWLGAEVCLTSRVFLALPAGMTAALAYLTRPEGLIAILPPLVLMSLGAGGTGGDREGPLPRDREGAGRAVLLRLTGILLLIIGFLAVASPYLLYLRKSTGRWQVTRKKSLSGLLGLAMPTGSGGAAPAGSGRVSGGEGNTEPRAPDLRHIIQADEKAESGAPPPAPSHPWLKALGETVLKVSNVHHPLLVLFLVAGVALRTSAPRRRRGEIFLLLAVLGLTGLLFLLRLHMHYLSRRHALSAAVLCLPWSALGVRGLSRLAGNLRLGALAGETRVAGLLLLGAGAILLPKAMKVKQAHKMPIREVARWIAEDAGGEPVIVGKGARRVAYYAGGRYFPLPPGSADDALRFARRVGADYLVIYMRKRGQISRAVLLALNRSDLDLRYHLAVSRGAIRYHWFVYRVR